MTHRTAAELEGNSYLWDGSEPGWVLCRSKILDIPTIFNRITRMVLLVEDTDEWRAITDVMLSHGVPLLDALPPEE
ncbi:hypothetical protein [Streptomyces sp. CBMA123]|uniref:hypothetical protein n=1 Tax=Streptomyces sp. CBMA123 TaxID=1896313 RepID=UPI001661D187|nr:hypothetical protein [Streptomyces sp. CBMA123]MBD0691147.1 hypothetical protein [Streptomyces sp. CBMA123]